jgi:hypothetical protein
MNEGVTVPERRRPEREFGIRELRNAGKVVAELAAQGRLEPGRRGGLVGRRPLPRRSDVPPLSETFHELRNAEDR